MKTKVNLIVVAAACSLFAFARPAQAQGTAFTYQGQLSSGANTANGTFDVKFTLFSANAGGSAIAGPVTKTGIGVTNGLFTTAVDFGNVFAGSSNWLEIAVRTNGAPSFSSPLQPRQQLTPAPYAIYAETANASNLLGTISTASVPGVALLAGGNAFSGNQTIAGSLGIGTTTPFTQLANSPNNIYGSDGFGLSSQSLGWNSGSFGYAAGFYNPGIGGSSDGLVVKIAGTSARVMELLAENTNTVLIAQGNGNVGIGTNAPSATLDVNGSGHFAGNVGIGTTSPGAPLDVQTPSTPGTGSLISQFGSQFAPRIQFFDETLSAVAGPEIFFAADNGGQIASSGSIELEPSGDVEIRNGGGRNLIMSGPGGGEWSFFDTIADSFYWDISGDSNTFAISDSGIGYPFAINRTSGNVGINTTTPQHALDVNGNIFFGTQRNGQVFHEIGDTLYLGAEQKYLGNTLLSPLGGSTDWINLMANPISAGIMFGLAGPSTTDPHSNVVALMVIKPNGMVGIGTNTPQAALHVVGNILATGTVTGTSDRNVKTNFAEISAEEVLNKVAGLPITRWNYNADAGVAHIGPMAQDFYAAFNVGMDDKHISMVDADGVALAAIQGLNQKVEEKDAKIKELEARLEKLERLINAGSEGAK
ncbi:MAG TPA: tail fiber domain-containing protein [Verrucomicrobiae bacterium]|jgi:hypothetical protein